MTEKHRFPSRSWAWPHGDLHRLLLAAISCDRETALNAAKRWLDTHDIDEADFRECRLLLSVINRFGKALADCDAYPRLTGLQRMLWTKSRFALRETLPAIKEMAASGIPVMLLKGAARIAIDPDVQKSRVSHDTDILVPREHAQAALDILTAAGWTPSTGESLLSLSQRLPMARSVNMFYGHFGDVDLHFSPADTDVPSPEFDAAVWERAEKAQFFDVPVLVPCAEDRLAITIASSALDAHAHSDWVVDNAALLRETPLDTELVVQNLSSLGLLEQAAISLSYLNHAFGIPIEALGEIERLSDQQSLLSRLAVRLECKPRSEWTKLSKIARGVTKQLRMARKRNAFPRPPKPIKGRVKSHTTTPPQGASFGQSQILCSASDPQRRLKEIEIIFETTGARRRYDFEVNSDTKHIARLRFRTLGKSKKQVKAFFQTELDATEFDENIWIESRPNRNQRSIEKQNKAKYSAVPFVIEGPEFSPALE